jgi:hypothetical protein
MKESTKKLINEQIKKVLAELEQVEDVADRVELRIEAIEMIYKVSGDANIENIIPQGKDSIKEDKAKNPVVVEEEEEEVLEIPEEMVNEVEPEPELPEVEELEEVSMDEILNAGDSLDPEVAAQAASEIEEEEINPDEEELPEVPEDIQAEFDSLESIANVNAEVVEHKIFIANWIHEDDAETVELYINYFASNIEEDENGDPMYIGEELHLDFLNENNIAGFVDYINVLSE